MGSDENEGLNYDGCEEGLDADEGLDDGGALGARDERCETGLDERCETGLDVRQAKTASDDIVWLLCGGGFVEAVATPNKHNGYTYDLASAESLLWATLLLREFCKT